MFNKYRGQVKTENTEPQKARRVSEVKTEPKPVLAQEMKDIPEPEIVPSSFFTEEVEDTKPLDASEKEHQRQMEEDEWFRKFKGEPEQVPEPMHALKEPKQELFADEEKVPQEETAPVEPESSVSSDEMIPAEEILAEEEAEAADAEPVPEQIEAAEEESSADVTDAEENLPEDIQSLSDEIEADLMRDEPEPAIPEPSELEKVLEEEETESAAYDYLEETVTEEPVTSTEEDDEQWMKDLLTDIAEKTGADLTAESAESSASETPMAVNYGEDYPKTQVYEDEDESEWYQSTPLIRTAALIVLDLTEEDEDEEYVEESPEDAEEYHTEETTQEEWIPNTDEVLKSIDEVFQNEPEPETEEITINDVDERLASLLEEEPKDEFSLDEMLDNMDRIIQETEPAAVRFVEEPAEAAPAAVKQSRPNPNRSRKKKKKKKR